MNAEACAPRKLRWLAALLVGLALGSSGFIALGVWQLERLEWKLELTARLESHLHAQPVPAPGPSNWPTLTRVADEYRRVFLHGEFDHARATLVAATTALGSGYWVMTPLLTEAGYWVLVNRGFVPLEWRDRARRQDGESGGPLTVTGLLRFSEPRGRLWQHNDPVAGRWYSRDVTAIAAARGLDASIKSTPVAPYFIDESADGPAAARTWPRAAPTVVTFPNNHLAYAVTWFALAAMAAAAIGYLVIDERRLRRRHRLMGDLPAVCRTI